MSSSNESNDELMRRGERVKELIETKKTLSSGRVEKILRIITATVPEKTSKDVLLEIIYTCDGNMMEIEKKVQELWENGAEDDWKPIISRAEKVKIAEAKEKEKRIKERQAYLRAQSEARRNLSRREQNSSKINAPKKIDSHIFNQQEEIVDAVEIVPVTEPVADTSVLPMQDTSSQCPPESYVQSSGEAYAEYPPEVFSQCPPESFVQSSGEATGEYPPEVYTAYPPEAYAPVRTEVSVEVPTSVPIEVIPVPQTIPEAPVLKTQVKRVVRKIQRRKPLEFSLGSFASAPAITSAVSFGAVAQPDSVPELKGELIPESIVEPKVEPMPQPMPQSPVVRSSPMKPMTSVVVPAPVREEPMVSQPENDPMRDYQTYPYYYPGMYPGFSQPHIYFPDYYGAPPGMNPESGYPSMQMPPPMYGGAPTDKPFTPRPSPPIPAGINPNQDVPVTSPATADKAPGMRDQAMYSQPSNVQYMPYGGYPNYASNQGYIYGGYPRNMMNHGPQNYGAPKPQTGIYDNIPGQGANAPQQDPYGNSIPQNRGMMDRIEVPPQNGIVDNSRKGYNYVYNQRNQPMDGWYGSQPGRY